jgi:hypothetical protein
MMWLGNFDLYSDIGGRPRSGCCVVKLVNVKLLDLGTNLDVLVRVHDAVLKC